MTAEEEVKTLTIAKTTLIESSVFGVHENKHLREPVYHITIPVAVWHAVFKTDKAKELGYYDS